jgi:hypothetical protein
MENLVESAGAAPVADAKREGLSGLMGMGGELEAIPLDGAWPGRMEGWRFEEEKNGGFDFSAVSPSPKTQQWR